MENRRVFRNIRKKGGSHDEKLLETRMHKKQKTKKKTLLRLHPAFQHYQFINANLTI